jgi:hypothetical protein
MTPSVRIDVAAAWRDRDHPSHSRSFLGGDQMSRALVQGDVRNLSLIKLISFQQFFMRNCAICEITMASINGKE